MPQPSAIFARDHGPCEPPLDDRTRLEVERELGVVLPAAYVDLARKHNGGVLALDAHPMSARTTWASDHIGITSIAAIGRTSRNSLCGEQGSQFWLNEWGYPDIGVYFADCPSAGHDMLALDYRGTGEPPIVHVDQEIGYVITPVAPSFAEFLNGLRPEESFGSE